jgi:hypothetical protein
VLLRDRGVNEVVSSLVFHPVPLAEKETGLAAMRAALGELHVADHGLQRIRLMHKLFRVAEGGLCARARDRRDRDADRLAPAVPRRARALVVRVILVAIAALAIAACAGTHPGSPWKVRRAEQLHAEGRNEEAFRLTEQEIAWGSTAPSPSLVQLHLSILRALDRHTEADALFRFADRYFTGEEIDDPDHVLFQRDCGERQPGYELIRSFGQPEKREYEIGRVVVTFAVDERGAIRDIEVLSAREPAAAWAGIDAVASAKVRERRLAELVSRDPSAFPIPLCFTKNFDPFESDYPDDRRIRGSD